MPEYALSRLYPAVLAQDFTVCWWEQRGSGLSYSADMAPETLTVEQLISDTLEVTRFLCERFGQEEIYLMGHSWGSFIGIQAAARRPELYRAYVAMAQITRQLESERLAYAYMIDRYAKAGKTRMVRKLKRTPLTELDTMPSSYRSLRDKAMHGLGIGTTHEMRSVVSGIFWPVMRSRDYTLGERIAIWRGKWSSDSTRMWNQLLATDVTALVRRLELPAYFFHGVHDYTVSYTLARDYLERLEAPVKGFYTFPHSAHSPLFEEPENAQRILREDVLAGTNTLADAR
jgi:pimeloyl-ACP methyl ester carboxylesterase